MGTTDLDYLAQRERQRDILAEVQQDRLVREAVRAARENAPRREQVVSLRPVAVALARIMAWLGERLTTWSCRLRTRYVDVSFDLTPDPCG